MLKAMAKTDSGALLVFGLSNGNIKRLRRNEPIVFQAADVGLDSGETFIISYKFNGKCAVPHPHPENMALIGLSDASLKVMREKWIYLDAGKFRIVLFQGSREEDMERMLSQFITPETTVTHSGFSPSDIPPCRN